jgi:DNA repair exonuclease SbcCD nuclease subunit
MSFIDSAIEVGAPILLAGDLFDVSKPPPEFVSLCRRAFTKCKEAEIPVKFLDGNHDKTPTHWGSAIHDWPDYVGDGRLFRLGDHTAIASDYQLHDDIKAFIDSIPPEPDIAFLHQAARQALPFEGAWNCDLEWLPQTIKLAVLGDIHKPLDMPLSNGRMAYYTGASHPRDITQLEPKTFIVVNDDLSITRKPLVGRAISKFTCTSVEDIEVVNSWLKEAVPVYYNQKVLLPFAWVVHSPEVFPDIRKLVEAYVPTGKALLFCDPAPSAEAVLEISDVLEETEELNLTSMLNRYVSREKNPLLFNYVTEILTSQKVMDTVLAYRHKVLHHG